MSLHSMKLSKKQSSHEIGATSSHDGPRFPFGLQISLDDDTLKKLGFDSMPAVGTEMIVVGVGRVTRASENSNQNGVNRDVSIQLERVEIEPLDDDTAVDAVSEAVKDV